MAESFDFKKYNEMVNPVAAGLKIALANNLIKDALQTLVRFDNPLSADLMGVGVSLKEFQVKYKEAAELRKKLADLPGSEQPALVAERGGV